MQREYSEPNTGAAKDLTSSVSIAQIRVRRKLPKKEEIFTYELNIML